MEAASHFPDPVESRFDVQPESAHQFGEVALRGASKPEKASSEAPTSGRYMYRRCDVSDQASALERTDLSNPEQPFFDF